MEDSTLYPVSCASVVAFHPELDIEKVFVVRSFNHTFEHLNDIGYLDDEMLPYFDPITARQLRDCALAVYNKKERFPWSEIFSCELKIVIELLKKWLADKYFKRFKVIDFFKKQTFRRENIINRDETKCVICGLCLLTAVSDLPGDKITTYLDFVVQKEHAFTRNIFHQHELKQSIPISTIENYHKSFRKVLQWPLCYRRAILVKVI